MLFLLLGVLAQNPWLPWPVPLWNCPVLAPAPPATNATQLRPGNIKVVMALGDSISAGFAMKGFPPSDFLEYRDFVYSIGGAPAAQTIPNYLAKLTGTQPIGAAQSWTIPLTPGYWLDGAVSMAKIQDVPSQIEYLINASKTEYANQFNFQEDWKLLTLLIGANNICGSCLNASDSVPAYFEQQLVDVLTQIHESIPRVFVNVVGIFNISGVWFAGQTKEYCKVLWDGITNHECYCLTTGVASDRETMDKHSIEFNKISAKIAAQFAALNDPNFTVVYQPGLTGFNITAMGERFLSDLDCFHPNEAANRGMALAIWNNMFTPGPKKQTNLDTSDLELICPDENTFLQ